MHPGLLRVIGDAAAVAGDLETGGPLIGTVQRSWTAAGNQPLNLIVSVLATVPPGPALRAGPGSVALGRRADGERAASALRWWRSVTGLDLLHLGDWHKHHLGSPQPSAGDRRTAEEMHAECSGPLWLSAIAVGERREREKLGAEHHRAGITRSSGEYQHVRFFRASPGRGLKPVPVRVEGHALPSLPALSWHVADSERFAAECRLLHGAGVAIAIEPAGNGARPGLRLRLEGNGAKPLTVVTGPRYPYEAPTVLDERGLKVRRRVPWSADRFLVDLVKEAG